MDETKLIEQLKAGDESAWSLAIKRYEQDLYACAANFLGVGPDAENAVQDVWLQAHLKMAVFEWRGSGSLYAWLRKICVYKAFAQIRNNHRVLLAQTEDLEALAVCAAHEAHAKLQEQSAQFALAVLVKQALRNMGEHCTRILELRELDGLSYADVARAMKRPIGTVMSRLARCRRLLKETLQAQIGVGR